MEGLDQLLQMFQGGWEVHEQRNAEYLQRCEEIPRQELSEYHGKLHGKQPAWEDTKQEYETTKNKSEECDKKVAGPEANIRPRDAEAC